MALVACDAVTLYYNTCAAAKEANGKWTDNAPLGPCYGLIFSAEAQPEAAPTCSCVLQVRCPFAEGGGFWVTFASLIIHDPTLQH